ncbi:MAG: chondroitinase-B domain-containing protein [Bacteroidota bacterium]
MQFAKADDIRINATPGQVYNLPAILNDTHIIITGSGSSGAPFILAGSGSKTTLSGNSSIFITGDFITVRNLSFINNQINYRENEALMQIGTKKNAANNNTISNCDFRYTGTFPDMDVRSQFYWIEFFGKTNVVDKCIFEGKQNRLPVIHVNSKGWTGDNNTISNCIFKNVKSRKGEALEAIRVGFGNSRSNCKIINNNFVNYFGDSETISCKSSGVNVSGNTFTNCRSGVSLRLGDSCQINNNKFTNTVWPIRVSGAGHVISNNVFDSPTSSITFMKGGNGCTYKTVDNIIVNDNVFVGRLDIKVLQSSDCDEVPKSIVMRNNFLYTNALYKIADGDYGNAMHGMSPALKPRTDGIKEFKYSMKNFSPATDSKIMQVLKTYQNLKNK